MYFPKCSGRRRRRGGEHLGRARAAECASDHSARVAHTVGVLLARRAAARHRYDINFTYTSFNGIMASMRYVSASGSNIRDTNILWLLAYTEDTGIINGACFHVQAARTCSSTSRQSPPASDSMRCHVRPSRSRSPGMQTLFISTIT